jgi:hypothetical protein
MSLNNEMIYAFIKVKIFSLPPLQKKTKKQTRSRVADVKLIQSEKFISSRKGRRENDEHEP